MVIQMYYNYYNTYKVVRNIKEDINEDMSGWEYIDFQILGRKITTVYAKIYLKNIIDKFNIRFDETITNLECIIFVLFILVIVIK